MASTEEQQLSPATTVNTIESLDKQAPPDRSKRPNYPFSASIKDWWNHTLNKSYTDELVEERLLSILPFFPEADATRESRIINTDIGNRNYIHEFFIENKEKPLSPDQTRDVVLVHGYAASLGLFVDNFDDLSSIPGIRLHAIDMLGFGFSSRPKFPSFPSKTEEEVHKVEDWFIDSIEEWRKKRNIEKFVLIGHSFGGYLSACYAMKYNKKLTDAAGKTSNMVDKLVLVSPVGVERSKFSLLKDISDQAISSNDVKKENASIVDNHVEDELNVPQKGSEFAAPSSDEPKTRSRRIIEFMWANNFSPFSIVRNIGPYRSKAIAGWTTWRFGRVFHENPKHFANIHNYMYRNFNGKGSGEYAITRVLDFGAVAKLPLMDRCPQSFTKAKIPTLWMYGDYDWMNVEAGKEITKEINKLARKETGQKLAQFRMISDSGHHIYLDNPRSFKNELFRFLGY